MKRERLTILTALACLALVLTPALAQDWKGGARLSGRVTDEATGDPIAGAKVMLHPAGNPGAGPEPIITNDKGRWSYLGLAGGPWVIVVEADGYIGGEVSARANEFGAGPPINTPLRTIPEEVLQEQAASKANAKLEEGNALFQAGDFAGARASLEAAMLEIEPEHHAPILLGIAQAYYQEENLDEALKSLERALEVDPENVAALKLISSLLISAGREAEAQEYMARLPEGEALEADAYLNVGISHYNEGRMDEALTEFNKSIESHPEDAEGYYYRALVYMGKGENDLSVADFKKHLELSPDSSRASEIAEFMSYLEPEG